jgi:hypothetical protein
MPLYFLGFVLDSLLVRFTQSEELEPRDQISSLLPPNSRNPLDSSPPLQAAQADPLISNRYSKTNRNRANLLKTKEDYHF